MATVIGSITLHLSYDVLIELAVIRLQNELAQWSLRTHAEIESILARGRKC